MKPRAKFSEIPKVGSSVKCVWCVVGRREPLLNMVPCVTKIQMRLLAVLTPGQRLIFVDVDLKKDPVPRLSIDTRARRGARSRLALREVYATKC
jgi:hypothetical protein